MNKEHMAILRDALSKEDISIWNKWRKANSKIKPDLSGVNLIGVNLIGADFRYAILSGANLIGVDLCDADFRCSDLIGARGVKSVSGIGKSRRFVFSYIYENEIRIQAGYRNVNIQYMIAAINTDYADDESGRLEYLAGIEYLTIGLKPLLTGSK